MATTTANLGLTLPTPNVDTGWGSTLNTDFTLIDNLFALGGNGTSVGLNIGSGKTLGLGGTLLLGSGDGTGATVAPTIRGAARTGTNVTGPNITIDAANGTGTGGSGGFIFRTARAGAAGTTANTMQNSLIIDGAGNVGIGTNGAIGALEVGGYINAAEYSASAGAGGRVNFNATTVAGTSTPIALIKGLLTNGTASFAGDLGFFTSVNATYNQRMSITGSGGVSFGSSGTAYGSSGQVLTSNGNAPPTWSTPTIASLGTQTFAAPGNTFTGIPSWAKSITIAVGNMDGSATSSDVLVRLGTSAGIVSSGYSSTGTSIGSTPSSVTNATGFIINIGGSLGSGIIRLSVVNGVSWISEHTIGAVTKTCVGGGVVNLPGALDRIQILPTAGTFAASGAVDVFYQ